ncbi:ATP-binding cassette domain-containing protein [Hyphomicrobium sp. MC1]|uniref:ATP-binding cassette domain-containing protein n=1 Tax=Hyphomicrobium sp. (strain MC1) TaxID=717785 RepID=UPI000213EB72|nr:ATP-binding cassette domain-containing protein [Hyphomicrobium sp. MC1]CCB66621.1 alkanesulfonate transport protein, ATP-binding protein [Hyphomicrobium sp. MC1]
MMDSIRLADDDAIVNWTASHRDAVSYVPGLSLTVRNLRISFKDREVLNGLNFHIPAGQFVAIVGKSGCGKSTLLRLIVGLDRPSGGEFWFGADSKAAWDEHTVRVMFQEPRLLPWARVISNVEVGLGRDRRSSGARELALATLQKVGLGDRREEWPSVLSGGQRQRVALARALVSRPQILALDEPLGALDALTRISMQKLLEHVWRDQGFTALLVTHDVAEAITLADRVLLIENGTVKLDLTVDIPRPRSRGSVEVGKLESRILDELFQEVRAGEDA